MAGELLGEEDRLTRAETPLALIVAPTRELAEQIHDAIGVLGRQTGLRSATAYGGVSINPQINRFKRGIDINFRRILKSGATTPQFRLRVKDLACFTQLLLDLGPLARL